MPVLRHGSDLMLFVYRDGELPSTLGHRSAMNSGRSRMSRRSSPSFAARVSSETLRVAAWVVSLRVKGLAMAKALVADELWEMVAPLLPPEPQSPREDLPQEMGCGSAMTCCVGYATGSKQECGTSCTTSSWRSCTGLTIQANSRFPTTLLTPWRRMGPRRPEARHRRSSG